MQAGPPPEFWIGFFVCFGIIFAVALLIQILFLLTLYKTQCQVAERNREIQPGTVWWTILINLIPLAGPFWCAFMVNKLSNSLRREFEDRGWRTDSEGFGRTAGLVWAWGGLVSLLVSLLQYAAQFGGAREVAMLVSLLNLPIGIGLLVFWILYWVQMYQYGKRLREGERGYARGSLEEDYDDEYRRPRHDEEDYQRRDDNQPRRRPPEGDDERGDYDDRRDRPRRDEH